MPKASGQEPRDERLGEILRHLKALRASGKETVRKMTELEETIETLREQQEKREAGAGAGKKETRQR